MKSNESQDYLAGIYKPFRCLCIYQVVDDGREGSTGCWSGPQQLLAVLTAQAYCYICFNPYIYVCVCCFVCLCKVVHVGPIQGHCWHALHCSHHPLSSLRRCRCVICTHPVPRVLQSTRGGCSTHPFTLHRSLRTRIVLAFASTLVSTSICKQILIDTKQICKGKPLQICRSFAVNETPDKKKRQKHQTNTRQKTPDKNTRHQG